MNWQYLFCYMTVDAMCIVFGLILSWIMRADSGSETQVRYFRLLLASFFGFVVTDMIWAALLLSGIAPVGSPVLSLLSFANKIAVVLAAYFWFLFGESHLGRTFIYRRKTLLAAALPLIAVPVLYAIDGFAGASLSRQAAEAADGGPLSAVITAMGLAYLVVATADSLVHASRAQVQAERRTYLTFAAFVIAPIVGAIIDIFVPNMPVMAPAILVSLLLVVLRLQGARISGDALTGLNNRRRADAYLEDRLAHASAASPVYLFIIDMDRFKDINDTYGHLEGDHALQIMANALRRACDAVNGFAARWGGDEFIVICANGAISEPDSVADIIKRSLSDEASESDVVYLLSCSIGFAWSDSPHTDARDLMQDADRQLYRQKQLVHSASA